MKNYLPLLTCTFLLTGCNPMNTRQEQAREFMQNAERTAKAINQKYQPEIRDIKPYQVYRYQTDLLDPFQAKAFAIKKAEEPTTPATLRPDNPCKPPQCTPPKAHPKELLENYNLSDLSFVGTLNKDGKVGLVKTPDYGVVRVQVGNYMGKNNGRVLAIKESAIVLHEKIYKSGLWEDKKSVLVIKR